MAANDLTTLAAVKAWLNRTDTNSDAALTPLVTSASRQIYSYLQRPTILPQTVTEVRDGTGGKSLLLRQYPVTAISALSVDGISIDAPAVQNGIAPGYYLEPWSGAPPGIQQKVNLVGHEFRRGQQNVRLTYSAGYQISAEAQTVSGAAATVVAPFGAWASDGGVSYADGTPLAKVSSSPSVGQYTLGSSAGAYAFASGDDGKVVLISYGFIPSDLADACNELVGERYKYSQRIGEKTHSLGGNETVTFDNSRMTPLIVSMLQPYKNVLPI